jgi:hypothetical protein
MKQNVADVLGKKFKAYDIQCEVGDDILICSGELTPDYEHGREPDWTIEVNSFVGRKVTQTGITKLTPIFSDVIWVPSAGGIKICMPRLGNGLGSVELICSEDESELIEYHKDWQGSIDDLRNKNRVFEEVKK